MLMASDGTLHFGWEGPVPWIASVLDVTAEGEIRGIRLPGADYRPPEGIEVVVEATLTEQKEAWRRRLLPVPGAALAPSDVVLRAAPEEGTIWIVPPEKCVAALRKAFQQIDADRAAGREVVTADAEPFRDGEEGPQAAGENRPVLLPPRRERLEEDLRGRVRRTDGGR